MAVEEIIFKISADTSDANKETNKLEADLEGVNEAAKELMGNTNALGDSFEDVYGDIKPLSGRLGELEDRMYELALAGETGTKEFQELQGEAVRLRQTIISVDKSVDQLAEQGQGLGAGHGQGQGQRAEGGEERSASHAGTVDS